MGSPLAGRLLDAAGFSLYGLVGLAILAITLLWAIVMLPVQSPDSHVQRQSRQASSMLELTHRPLVRLLIGLRYLPTIYYGLSSVMIPLMLNELAGNLEQKFRKQEEIKRSLREELLPGIKSKANHSVMVGTPGSPIRKSLINDSLSCSSACKK